MPEEKVIRLVERDGGKKFWNITIQDKKHVTIYGKAGQRGRSKTTNFESKTACSKNAKMLIEEQKKKGYKEENENGNQQKGKHSKKKKFSSGDKDEGEEDEDGDQQKVKAAKKKKFSIEEEDEVEEIEEPLKKKIKIKGENDIKIDYNNEIVEEITKMAQENKQIHFENENNCFFKIGLEGTKCIEKCKGKSITKIFPTKQIALDHIIKTCQTRFSNGYFIIQQEKTEKTEENRENCENEDNEKNKENIIPHIENNNNANNRKNVLVDRYSPYYKNCNVYNNKGVLYNVLLHKNNKCFVVQVLQSNSKPVQYYTWARKSQFGFPDINTIFGPNDDPIPCIQQFYKELKNLEATQCFMHQFDSPCIDNNNKSQYGIDFDNQLNCSKLNQNGDS